MPTPRVGTRRIVVAHALACASLVAAALAAPTPAAAAKPKLPTPATLAAADSLTMRAASPERLAAFRAWAKGAGLDDLVYVLRHPPAELGDLEAPALEAALERTPKERAALRSSLFARLTRVNPERAKRLAGEGAAQAGTAAASSVVSVFRVALVLPGEGPYAEDAEALRLGFGMGMASRRSSTRPPLELRRYSSGAGDPVEVAAAFDSAASVAALVCGGADATASLLLAAGSRWSGLPTLVAAGGDAATRRLSPRAFWLGPTGEQRGRALATATHPGPNDRVAVLHSAASDTSFSGAFVAACRTRGAQVVHTLVYSPGNASFAAEIRSIVGQRVNLLFWDGDATEAVALLRQLTLERVSLKLCGGQGLDPERHHQETRVLLEGVTYLPEDWALAPDVEAKLVRAAGSVAARLGPVHVRGYLAGRLAAAALESGALTPEEVSAALERLAAGGGEPRTLDARSEGGELPVFTVAAGKAERVR